MLKPKTLLILTFCTLLNASFAQETVSIMYYNLLNYPQVNSARITYLETIVQHVQPDIFVVNELTSAAGSNSILNNALNTGSITYAAANYVSGPDDNNMLYYNTAKLGLIDQNEIPTSLRDINEYILYYKNPNLTASSDTAYLYVYGAHLKAGSTASNEAQRASETATLRSYLNTRSNAENTIVGGDFNIYYSSEQAYTNLTGETQANLYDVIGAGAYHNNNMYSIHFTQSTRTDAFDGGSTGGMDDRFDYILFSDDMINGDNGVRYKTGSYRAVGQDGLRWNSSLISPTNNSEPSNVINALYYMSDHIPVYMEMEVGGTIGIEEIAAENLQESIHVFPNPFENTFGISHEGIDVTSYQVLDVEGRVLIEKDIQTDEVLSVDASELKAGTYIVRLLSESGEFTTRIVKQ